MTTPKSPAAEEKVERPHHECLFAFMNAIRDASICERCRNLLQYDGTRTPQPSDRPAKELAEMEGNVRRALRALYVEVPESVARDINKIVWEYIDALTARVSADRPSMPDWKRQYDPTVGEYDATAKRADRPSDGTCENCGSPATKRVRGVASCERCWPSDGERDDEAAYRRAEAEWWNTGGVPPFRAGWRAALSYARASTLQWNVEEIAERIAQRILDGLRAHLALKDLPDIVSRSWIASELQSILNEKGK